MDGGPRSQIVGGDLRQDRDASVGVDEEADAVAGSEAQMIANGFGDGGLAFDGKGGFHSVSPLTF